MRILIVQTAFLGDVVLTIPLLRELRRVRREAEIWTLTTAVGDAALEGLECIDRRLVLDKRWDRRGRSSYWRVLRELMRTPFDAAIAAHRSIRTGVILRLCGASLRVGFAGAPGAWAYRHSIEWQRNRHAVHRYLALSSPLGGNPAEADPQPRLDVEPKGAGRVDALLSRHGIGQRDELLCLAPGSRWRTKRWLPERFAGVAVAAAAWGLRPVLIGSADERELCQRVASLARADIAVLAGETSIRDLVALIARSRLAICNDSGTAHVASAVGTPVVSVFGSTASAAGYAAFGPNTRVVEHPDLACRPCGRHGSRSCPVGHFRCMTEVPVGRVLQRAEELLAATHARPRGEASRSHRDRVQVLGNVVPG